MSVSTASSCSALLDVVPPGVDEIFAIFRILDLLQGGGRVVIDMAPTGHALELLRTPARLLAWARLLLKTLAAHRSLPFAQDAAVEVATLSQNVRELAGNFAGSQAQPGRGGHTAGAAAGLRNSPTAAGLEGAGRAAGGGIRQSRVDRGRCRKCSRCQLAVQWQTASLASLRKNMQER